MDTKKLWDWSEVIVLLKEIHSLIEAHGGEPAEVKDEEREKLIEAVEKYFPYCMTFDANLNNIRKDTKERIIALLRQPRRTVSREQATEWITKLWNAGAEHRTAVAFELGRIFAELGIPIEPKGGGEEKE